MKNYFELLGITENSSHSKINRRAYELGKKLHPGKNPLIDQSQEQFIEMMVANTILTTPNYREIYQWITDHESGIHVLRESALEKHYKELEAAENHGVAIGKKYLREPFWVFKEDFRRSSYWSFWDLFTAIPW